MTEMLETTLPQAEVPTMEAPELRVADRCDAGRCGAQAFVVTQHEAGPLFWCGHHFREYEMDLMPLVVVDKRETINKAPSPTS